MITDIFTLRYPDFNSLPNEGKVRQQLWQIISDLFEDINDYDHKSCCMIKRIILWLVSWELLFLGIKFLTHIRIV